MSMHIFHIGLLLLCYGDGVRVCCEFYWCYDVGMSDMYILISVGDKGTTLCSISFELAL